ncbi:MAG: ABC transporter substrate-binding protein, partial [Phycisphaerales bacterium JB038]
LFRSPSGSSYTERLQRYVHEQFRQAGILVNLDALEWSVFNDRLLERDFEMVSLSFTGSSESDPFQVWHSSQAENRGSNYSGFKNADADRIIEQARRTLDYEQRMEMWHALHAIIHEEQPYTFLSNRATLGFLDARFRNVRQHPLRHYIAEWYVPTDAQLH